MAEDRPTEQSNDELIAKLEEELRTLTVSDILLQTAFTISSLGFRKLSEEERDLGQARLAIEGLKAIVPLLADAAPKQITSDLDDVIANLQLVYAKTVSEGHA